MRIATGIGISITTFIFGLIVVAADVLTLPLPVVPNLDLNDAEVRMKAAIRVSVCEMMKPNKSFDGKFVDIEATLYAVDDEVVVYPILPYCSSFEDVNPFIWIRADFSNYFGKNHELKYLLRSKRPFSEIDVRIRGSVSEKVSVVHEKLYVIKPETIEIISPWRKFEPKGAA